MNPNAHKEARMARTTRLTVRGIKVTSASQRRFIVVAGREHDISGTHAVTGETVTRVKFAQIQKRSDNLDTARAHARRLRENAQSRGLFVVVVDTVTGEEV